MLQFERMSRLDAHDERGPGGVMFSGRIASPQRPLHLDRPGHGGKPFANDIVPIQNKSSWAKPAPGQHRIDCRLNEVPERLGPRDSGDAPVPHALL